MDHVVAAVHDHPAVADWTYEKALNAQIYGRALYAMNHRAMVARYGARAGDCNEKDTYVFTRRPTTLVQQYKSIQCLMYQCTEGDVDKDPLFLELDAVAADLARRIVQAHPEYATASWG
jgi:hypothetical protein